MSKLNCCNRDYLACKVKRTYCMTLYRTCFPNPILDGKLHEDTDVVCMFSTSLPASRRWPGVEYALKFFCLFV